jgi:hypothetical protein
MLTETLLRIPFSVIGSMFSSADLSVAAGKINLSQAASGMILQHHKIAALGFFAAGYWKDF